MLQVSRPDGGMPSLFTGREDVGEHGVTRVPASLRLFFWSAWKDARMEDTQQVPRRRGVAINITLDKDAAELLKEIAPHKKGHGRFVSELLRAERLRREERERMRAAVLQVLEEPA
jgi:hypothetical protein